MGATDGQSNWPEMLKTLGKPGFLSGEDRNRTFGCFTVAFLEVREAQEWSLRVRFLSLLIA
jgi:hypothetical protein